MTDVGMLDTSIWTGCVISRRTKEIKVVEFDHFWTAWARWRQAS